MAWGRVDLGTGKRQLSHVSWGRGWDCQRAGGKLLTGIGVPGEQKTGCWTWAPSDITYSGGGAAGLAGGGGGACATFPVGLASMGRGRLAWCSFCDCCMSAMAVRKQRSKLRPLLGHVPQHFEAFFAECDVQVDLRLALGQPSPLSLALAAWARHRESSPTTAPHTTH